MNPGFHNPGSLCYMNALLQQLFAIPTLSQSLEMAVINLESANQNSDSSDSSDSLMNQLAIKAFFDLCNQYNQSSSPVISSVSLYEAMQNALKRDIDIDQTRDVADFFSDIINIFSKISLSLQVPHPLSEIKGSFSHCISANEDPVNKRLQHQEQFFYVSLSVDKTTCPNLEESLKQYTKLHQFPFKWRDETGVYMPAPLPSSKSTTFARLPRHLFFHLKRLRYDPKLQKKLKSFHRFDFPRVLDMRPFCSPEEGIASERYRYRLAGMIIHRGKSAYTGHYYSLRRKSTHPEEGGGGGEEKEEWLVFDDDRVSSFPQALLEERFFGSDECEAEALDSSDDDSSDEDSDDDDESSSEDESSDDDSSEESEDSEEEEEEVEENSNGSGLRYCFDSTYMLVYDRIVSDCASCPLVNTE